MNKNIFIEIVKFYRENLQEPIRKAFRYALSAFLKAFWEYVREYVIDSARKSIFLIESFLISDSGKEKKETVVEIIMSRLQLPLPLKPFKFLVKKILRDKIDDVVNGALEKVKGLKFLA